MGDGKGSGNGNGAADAGAGNEADDFVVAGGVGRGEVGPFKADGYGGFGEWLSVQRGLFGVGF